MGTIYDWQLRTPKDQPAGMPAPVGTVRPLPSTTATIIEKKDGNWSYCEEEDELPIEVWLLKHREVVLGGPDAEEVLLWTGMEVKLARTAATGKWMHKDLIVALNPSSLNWWWNAKFRPVRKRSVQKKLGDLQKALQSARSRRADEKDPVRPVRGESVLPQALQALPFDPFETDDKWLTARMPDPMRFHWNDVRALAGNYSVARNPAHRSGAKPRHPDKKGQRVNPPFWSFGVCADFEEAFKDIRGAAMAMKDGRLFQTRDPGGPEWVIQQVEFDLLDMAVWQAMAGRVGRGQVVDRVIELFHLAHGARIGPRPPTGRRAKPARHFTKRVLDVQ